MNFMKVKVALQCSIVACIIGVFSYYLFFNKKGIKKYLRLKKQQQSEKIEIAELNQEIQKLNIALNDWHENPYAKEKAAREELHMVYPNEKIYFIKTSAKGKK